MNAVMNLIEQVETKQSVKVGTGATIEVLKDKYPCTVFRSFKHGQSDIIEVRMDRVVPASDENLYPREYEFKVNLSGNKQLFKRLPNENKWYHVSYNSKTNQYNKLVDKMHIIMGIREKFELEELYH